ncbi:hypothetical protein [Marinomonas sp. IMCC 4694]|uniref:hypothetical protein n=1 Tax=Marinomonas sp. IMCC 4694 TaxID=2605432 RepID=UPI001653385B|nr:hypothetical protein [Marinomonas sp. IMCC 4694]
MVSLRFTGRPAFEDVVKIKVDLGEQDNNLPEQQKPIAAILNLGQLTRDIVE